MHFLTRQELVERVHLFEEDRCAQYPSWDMQHPDVVVTLDDRAKYYCNQGRYDRAERLYQRALARHKQMLGEGHPHVAWILHKLAMLYQAQERYNKAQECYKEAEVLYRLALIFYNQIKIHAPSVAVVMENYAALLQETNRNEGAKKLRQRAQKLRANHT
jgi:tetratricopeptide (TPR) repeat protein